MKKNWTMRVAVLMVALTLITSCFVSSTYAKYVVSGGVDETARVAKFGVTIEADGTLFADTYKAATNNPGAAGDDIADATSLTVVSSASGVGAATDIDNVVAPGTKNDTGMTFTVTGTPEVAVRVFMDIDANAKQIFLKTKTGLPDMTTADETDTFNQATDYYPVVFTLKVNGTEVAHGKLEDIKSYLDGASATVYPANTNLGTAIGTINLTWAWDFGDPANNQPDTLLGDLAAGTTLAPATPALTAGTDYNLDEIVKINVGIAQVD